MNHLFDSSETKQRYVFSRLVSLKLSTVLGIDSGLRKCFLFLLSSWDRIKLQLILLWIKYICTGLITNNSTTALKIYPTTNQAQSLNVFLFIIHRFVSLVCTTSSHLCLWNFKKYMWLFFFFFKCLGGFKSHYLQILRGIACLSLQKAQLGCFQPSVFALPSSPSSPIFNAGRSAITLTDIQAQQTSGLACLSKRA